MSQGDDKRWIAFIVVNTASNPVPLEWPQKDEEQRQLPSIDVEVKDNDSLTQTSPCTWTGHLASTG